MDEELKRRIEHRAFELYQERGGQHGYDFEDWLRAEKEIMDADKKTAAKPVVKEQPRSVSQSAAPASNVGPVKAVRRP